MDEAFNDLVKQQYAFLYKISRSNFKFGGCESAGLELLPEFDSVSGDFEKWKGWLEAGLKHKDYEAVNYGEIVLEPLVRNGLIYHFKGTIEWTSVSEENSDLKNRLMPLSARPIYHSKTGRIIQLKSSEFADSDIFNGAKVEYLDSLIIGK